MPVQKLCNDGPLKRPITGALLGIPADRAALFKNVFAVALRYVQERPQPRRKFAKQSNHSILLGHRRYTSSEKPRWILNHLAGCDAIKGLHAIQSKASRRGTFPTESTHEHMTMKGPAQRADCNSTMRFISFGVPIHKPEALPEDIGLT
ncbi:MAG: hypothetical protein A3E01_10065 [Gammaproteobacteria bacterium RIFCSPHIGHO2_12_FULL_63_22]|nr:MAG: hypothetical protein A3E01_10065 [Gammaproteobacteria bacterium RIFCSPHIGHO2_12_FULL_63_22]